MSFEKKVAFTNKKRVICEVLREIYDHIKPMQENTNIDAIVVLLEEANTMAKSMSNKLYEYHYNVTEHSEENQNFDKSVRLRKNRDDVHPQR